MRRLLVLLSLFAVSQIAHANYIFNADLVESYENGEFNEVANQNNGEYIALPNWGGLISLGPNAWTYISLEDLLGLGTLDFNSGSTYTLNFKMRVKERFNDPQDGFAIPGVPSEIGGILFANDSNVNSVGGAESGQAFNLSGTQMWGFQDFRYDFTEKNDNDTPTWQSFSINLNDFLSGSFKYLVFINDCDAEDCDNATQFSDVSITVPEPGVLGILALSLLGIRRFRK